ncbi:hypothetical protein [Paenibacillus sp. YYML68]|uniref:hypothetical protein n=1 Tax=Paenibacillus sp. YYML68 TaxID=2909250 RepID=UPI002491E303|nr:hypothetical protein [Paenibacillus sp. YYML68]
MKHSKLMSKLTKTSMALLLAGALSAQSAIATPAPAGIGNELEMEFNVYDVVYSNIVKLTWDDGEQAMKQFQTRRGAAQQVNYKVTAGTDFEDYTELVAEKVDVLLKVTGMDPNNIQSVTADGNAVQPVQIDGDTYYLLKDGVNIERSMAAIDGSMSIAFNSVTSGNPYSLKIVTVKDEVQAQEPPQLHYVSDLNNEGVWSITFGSQSSLTNWYNNLTSATVSKDANTTYAPFNLSEITLNSDNTITITGDAAQMDYNHWVLFYKFNATGYKEGTAIWGID